MNCSICNKNFNGLTCNKVLLDCKNIRICSDCAEKQSDFNRLSVGFESVDGEYQKIKNYFEGYLNSNNCSNEVKLKIQELITKCENKREKVTAARKQQEKQVSKECLAQRAEKKEILEKINNFLSTTGFGYEGYRIIKYHKVLCGESVLGTGFLSEFTASFADFFGAESDMFASKLSQARESATEKLIVKAIHQGANAIIGLDFDYVNFTGNLIGVIANGTAVSIEEINTKVSEN